ncbi:MAG: response regulator, partial [Pseudomonadota bacterium]
APAARFYALAFERLIPALRKGERAGVDAALAAMGQAYDTHRHAVDALVARAAARAARFETAAASRIEADTGMLRLILLAVLGASLLAAVLIRRSITEPLDQALLLARRVAAGDLRARGHARYQDEPGLLLDALDAMSASLAATHAARSVSELSLRRAKELTERLIDCANVAIVGLDRERKVCIFNRTASALTGLAAPQVLGRTWEAAAESTFTSASGEQRRIAWQNTELGDEGGEVALMAFGIDVTEQRAAFEATLRAQQLAEASARSKSEFLANMSHEIRTPMNAVIGMTRLTLNTELDARQRNYLERVDCAAHSLLGIINDILDFSKIEAGKLHFERRRMQLRQTLDHLAGMTVYRAQEKGLELLFDVAPEVPLEMLGDPLRLGQVLLSLVNNAIKFTERGEIIVAIQVLEVIGAQVCLQFEVRDTGIGIKPEYAARLFTAFSQADSSTTRMHGGSGLGLAIAHKLVEMMEGRLWVESEAGHGSRFLFTARFGRQSWPATPGPNGHDLAALRVLVVDDNAAAREILQGILESMQMRAGLALSAPDAIAELEKAERIGDPYRLVLMDWLMPSMDGLEAIRAIRANPAIARTLTIIMVTAYSRDELLVRADGMEQLGVLDKPVTPSSVLDAIVSGLQGGAPAAVARTAPERRLEAALQTLRGVSVLLVEDNEVNQRLAVDILTGLGLEVSVAGNGQVALDMLGVNDYDAVLMDCQMPVMDGFEASRLIRAQARLAHMPILAMTANAMSGDRERCLAAGMNEHISKPVNQESLALTLARWLAPAAHAAAAPQDGARADYSALRAAGIDVDAGRDRLHGNDIAYRKLMQQLLAMQARFEPQVRDALRADETERARRLVHHLHGIASNLGARALAAGALELGQALVAGSGVDSALAALAPRFGAVLRAIDAQLGVAEGL